MLTGGRETEGAGIVLCMPAACWPSAADIEDRSEPRDITAAGGRGTDCGCGRIGAVAVCAASGFVAGTPGRELPKPDLVTFGLSAPALGGRGTMRGLTDG